MATIVDVRTPAEFDEGHVPGSVNIPLDEVPHRIGDFRAMMAPIILCCRSGARSGSALAFLLREGVQGLENGGGWQDVLRRMNK
ncbi:MAG: rhodanese-like domain-containing protein [Flavobacteriales bacterium]|nr:rhodanese-like domain-containing protein [Flavobacteriales bacterium]